MAQEKRAPSEGERGVDLDAIWKEIGPSRRYLMVQWVLTTMATALYAIPIMDFVFIGYKPDHQCSHMENTTQLEDYLPDDVTNFTLHDVRYKQCSIDVTVNRSGMSSTHSLPCVAGINFSMPSDTSFTTEWSLVCDKAGLAQLTQTGVFGGQVAGRALSSILADRYGRKKVYVTSTLCAALFLVAQALAPYYYMFFACKVAVGVFAAGLVRSSYTLLIESLPQGSRHLASVNGGYMWVLGCLMLAATAYGMQGWSWRHLSLALYSFYLLGLLLPFVLNESLRWLLATGEVKEAEKILRRVCQKNGTDFSKIQPMLYKHTTLSILPSHNGSQGHDGKTDPHTPTTTTGPEDLADDTKLCGEDTATLRDVQDSQLRKEEERKRNEENGRKKTESKKVTKTKKEDEKILIATEIIDKERQEKDVNHTESTNEQTPKDEGKLREETVDDVYTNGKMSGTGGADGCSEGGGGGGGGGDGDDAGGKEGKSVMPSPEKGEGEEVFSAKYTVLDLFRYRAVFVPFLVTCLVWASNNLYYYVTMMGSAQLSGNRFLNFTLLNLVDIPAGVLALFLLPRFNRRPLAFGYGVVAALCLFLTVGLNTLGGGNSTAQTLATVSQFLGMFTLTGSYILLFTYHMEQYPTSLRAIGSGMAGTITEVTNMASPFLLLWAEKTAWAPGVFMGCFCCVASSAVWLLPETRHRKLADTIEEVQSWKRRRIPA